MNGCRADKIFAIKSMMQENPYSLVFILFFGSSIICGYACSVFERPLSHESGQNMDVYHNGVWLIIVTMTTVGYGDSFPKTYGGRIIGVFTCVWGMFLTSFFTVSLTNVLMFSPSQNKSYILLQRLFHKERLQHQACQAVSTIFKHNLIARQNDLMGKNKVDKNLLSSAREFRKQMVTFKETIKRIRSYNMGNTEIQHISNEVTNLGERVSMMQDQLNEQKKVQDNINSKLDDILCAMSRLPSRDSFRET